MDGHMDIHLADFQLVLVPAVEAYDVPDDSDCVVAGWTTSGWVSNDHSRELHSTHCIALVVVGLEWVHTTNAALLRWSRTHSHRAVAVLGLAG